MPPPCEVRFEVREEDGPVSLHASAGVDAAMEGMLLRAPKDCAVLFEIAVNGQRRFGARVETRATDVGRVWRHAGGRVGLPLVPGDVVTLKTSLEPEEFDATTRQEIPVGFGRLELEREIARPIERASAERPSILFIVMDTLRADQLSCYGNAEHETPALDALAARGLLHERAYATSSWTWPSTASMLTGLWPETHGVVSHAACYLDGSFDTLAEVLGRTNATTAAFVCNPLIDPTKGFSQGFETYDYGRDFRTSGAVVDDVRAWIARHAGTRFFLYLHWIDPHRPIKARREDFARLGVSPSPPPGSPAEALIEAGRILREGQAVVEGGQSDPDRVLSAEEQRWIRDAYSASVLSADHYVGEVLRELEERGLADTTLVVFTSDHGEELFDHGLFGHGQSLHQELVRVPLILAGPGVPRGVRSSAPVTNLALFETLTTRGGARERRADALDGSTVDLGAPVRGGPSTQYFSTETGWWCNRHQSVQYGVQEWPWVLVVAPEALPWGAPEDADPGDGQIRLFNLARDPGERVDRSAAEPEVVRALRQRWSEHLEAQAAIGAGPGRSAGPVTLDLLRRFGYTGDDK
jgi:arylsulfatase A-like enzyme